MTNFMEFTDTTAEIDLEKIAENTKLIRNFLGSDITLAAVVKANAYGHGVLDTVPVLLRYGADILAVATIAEALEIKSTYPHFPVLVMGITPVRFYGAALRNNVILTIDSLPQAEFLNQAAYNLHKTARVHIKYDTGFHRLGFLDRPESLKEIIKIFHMDHIHAEGIFSHLALASDEDNAVQYERFTAAIERLRKMGCCFRYRHIADSISAVDYPEYHMNMVRIGALLYGLRGFHKGFLPVNQAMTLKTKLTHITEVMAGEGVSYDYIWRASGNTRVGTLPIGYADGYPRNISGKATVSIHGRKAPVIGVICMDQCLVDLTMIPEADVGDDAILYGDGTENTLTIADISLLAGTNKNDIVSRIGRRVKRKYIECGE